MAMDSPVLIHIPHASKAISKGDFKDFLPSGEEIRHELIRLTDWYTDELYGGDWAPQNVVKFQHSRLVVDVERFVSDDEEPCAKVGMGVTYLKTTRGEPLRRLSAWRRKELINNYYNPHHQIFTKKVIQILERFNRCVIIDGHSYPTEPLPTQTNYSSTPEIGIGADELFTSPQLIELTQNYFKSHGLSVALNEPFQGTIIPAQIYKSRDCRVQSVMIEVRRDLYINEMQSQIDMVQNIAVTDIAFVKVFRPPFFGSVGGGSGGAIAIYTKRGSDSRKADPNAKGLENTILGGYSRFKEFFNPSYDKPNENTSEPDLRTTLYWNPYVLTNKKSPRIRITFFNNDISKKFQLVLEGVNGDGKMTRVVKMIDSKSQD